MLNTAGMVASSVVAVSGSVIGVAMPSPSGELGGLGAVAGIISLVILWDRRMRAAERTRNADAKAREVALGRIIDQHRKDLREQNDAHKGDMRTLLGENIEVMKQVAEVIKNCPRKDGGGT